MKRSILSASSILVLIVILVLINGISRGLFRNAYLDLSEGKLYSLSGGTKSLLSQIESPITLKYYFSKTEGSKFPSVKLYGNRIADLLREYARVSRGKITLETYDPRPDSEEEDWAQKYGITSIPARSGEKLFLGLVAINAAGKEQAIPVFDFQREPYLEYDISRAVSGVMVDNRPVVGILTALSLQGEADPEMGESAPWFFVDQLKESSEVKFIPATTETIESGLDVLVVMQPKNLSTKTLYAIDQFVMNGGHLMVMVDPFAQVDEPKRDPNNPMAGMLNDRSSSLNRVMESWGVTLKEKKVATDINLFTKVSSSSQQISNYITWLSLGEDRFNADDIVSGSLSSMVLPWAGAFDIKKIEGVTITPLLTTTSQSQMIEDKDYRFNGGDQDGIIRRFLSDNEQKVLAVRIHGKLRSAFPDGLPAEGAESAQSATPTLKESKGDANVIAIADVDFLSDRYSVMVQNIFGSKVASLLNDNLNFFLNCVENLSGSDALIGIRSRGKFSRPFTVVQQLEAQAQQRWQMEELTFQSKVDTANRSLQQLQSSMDGQSGAKQAFNTAFLDKIKQLRAEKAEAQKNLREVRRNLRQDIESLGTRLFLINTFLVPFLLLVFYLSYRSIRTRKQS